MKTQPTLLTALFLTLGIASFVPLSLQANPMEFSEADHCVKHLGGNPHMPPYLRGIDLSDAQEDAIFSILHNIEPQMHQKMKALHQLHENMMAQAASNQYDETAVKRLAETGAKLMAEVETLRTRTDHQLLFVLDENQRQQVALNKDRFADGHRPPF